MIGFIRGKVLSLKPSEILVDVGGVGYVLQIPLSTYQAISGLSEPALFVHTYLREDQIRLFGFFTEDEKKLFEILLKISGIGPSMALAILSGITAGDFADAIQNSRTEILTKIPGIGKTKAEKIIFELSRKNVLSGFAGEKNAGHQDKNDAIEALLALGFDQKTAQKAVEEAVSRNPDGKVESIVRSALAMIGFLK